MFCPECRSLMMPKEGQFWCRKCQAVRAGPGGSMMVSSAKQEDREMVVLEEDQKMHLLPRTQDVECPQCGTRDAYFFFRQTRKADEAETAFLECVKCKHRWRRYA